MEHAQRGILCSWTKELGRPLLAHMEWLPGCIIKLKKTRCKRLYTIQYLFCARYEGKSQNIHKSEILGRKLPKRWIIKQWNLLLISDSGMEQKG